MRSFNSRAQQNDCSCSDGSAEPDTLTGKLQLALNSSIGTRRAFLLLASQHNREACSELDLSKMQFADPPETSPCVKRFAPLNQIRRRCGLPTGEEKRAVVLASSCHMRQSCVSQRRAPPAIVFSIALMPEVRRFCKHPRAQNDSCASRPHLASLLGAFSSFRNGK